MGVEGCQEVKSIPPVAEQCLLRAKRAQHTQHVRSNCLLGATSPPPHLSSFPSVVQLHCDCQSNSSTPHSR